MPVNELNIQPDLGCITPRESPRSFSEDLADMQSMFLKPSFPIMFVNIVFALGSHSNTAQQVVTSVFC